MASGTEQNNKPTSQKRTSVLSIQLTWLSCSSPTEHRSTAVSQKVFDNNRQLKSVSLKKDVNKLLIQKSQAVSEHQGSGGFQTVDGVFNP